METLEPVEWSLFRRKVSLFGPKQRIIYTTQILFSIQTDRHTQRKIQSNKLVYVQLYKPNLGPSTPKHQKHELMIIYSHVNIEHL